MSRLRWLVVPVLWLLVAVPVAFASNDPLRQHQYGLDRIQAEAAWVRGQGAGVVIAIIDTGVNLRHEDLRDKLVQGRDFVEGNDDPRDRNGHGTHVAGIAAAATDNGAGIAGVAPASRIMPLRVLDADGTGVESDVANAIRFAVLQAQMLNLRLVVNMSLTDLKMTGTSNSRQIQNAIREAWFAGAVIVAAAGNEDLPYSDFPAAGPNVLSVGATDAADRRAEFSNRDPLVVAPGERIVSTFWDPASPDDDTAYATGSGTSMAAPHVSGLAALLLSTGLTNEQTVDRIVRTSDDLGPPGKDPDFGYGRINAARALGVAGAVDMSAAPPDAAPLSEGFDRLDRVGEVPVEAAAPIDPARGARGLPLILAALTLALAYTAARWNAGLEAERALEVRSSWEV